MFAQLDVIMKGRDTSALRKRCKFVVLSCKWNIRLRQKSRRGYTRATTTHNENNQYSYL
jgi:hypothetical protein